MVTFDEALQQVDARCHVEHDKRGKQFNLNHELPDFMRRGPHTALDLVFLKMIRIEDCLNSDDYESSAMMDSCIDMVNYARYAAAIVLMKVGKKG